MISEKQIKKGIKAGVLYGIGYTVGKHNLIISKKERESLAKEYASITMRLLKQNKKTP